MFFVSFQPLNKRSQIDDFPRHFAKYPRSASIRSGVPDDPCYSCLRTSVHCYNIIILVSILIRCYFFIEVACQVRYEFQPLHRHKVWITSLTTRELSSMMSLWYHYYISDVTLWTTFCVLYKYAYLGDRLQKGLGFCRLLTFVPEQTNVHLRSC